MDKNELRKDFFNMLDSINSDKNVETQINKIIDYLQHKYNKEFVPISYGDRYDKFDDDITILAFSQDAPQVVFKATRK